MATAPLFVADMTTLKSRLRLTGAASADALSILDQAVEDVRLGFYERLGATRVDVIVALDYVENPESADERTRALANSCELAWVKYLCAERMPMMFIDGSANVNQVWNDEAAFRSANERVLVDKQKRLWGEIEAKLEVLAGYEEVELTVRADVLEPDVTPDLPGGSIWPSLRNTP